jgi:hypothetical protein
MVVGWRMNERRRAVDARVSTRFGRTGLVVATS